MTDKQIIIKDYFNIMRDENGRIFCIQEIGDPKSLIKAIREQNEYIQAKEQECEKIKNWIKGMMFYTDCSNWFERFTTAFEDWENDLTSQLDQLKAKNIKIYKTLTEIKFLAREFLKRTGQVVPYEIKQILQKISEVSNDR